ncbi:Vps52A, component of GARP and EARP complexes [Monocercomonoides exilis]|uniref:Vps52A, component of GARP and EARP complexes n=1 Tax=Monocercomonoides exilis TaxID=2049356 RepID=UPI003559C121|nr:Vps52A, component of GARP and EARP complexes [Monocercomonoides exilis]|eukprot:MONOS_2662.1-p1 / transcript=MONOS_2662.1 / gene=MONOS_2662 / organism=Monocercomonoides_exilis_PA203 / gene_product= Vps52A, component of GARP (Golgi-associated retrograde protein) and EARP (endosome-associated recycling protein) complexes / transcript_product= Vps52A, component of GARP (Golgi-associated retrograde protein) and EARP (endosome-associated recycling protein) complexes / location=Mono_scaffold00056:40675-43803(-) / protein_length=1023 / sequence_SO=supercontig / SO=protein_coding /
MFEPIAVNLHEDDLDFEEIEEELKRFGRDSFVERAIQSGKTIPDSSKALDKQIRKIEAESVEDYVKEEKLLFDLHEQIKSCDDVLLNMEKLLEEFQDHLSSLTSEIRNLQDSSLSMNHKLKNRKEFSKALTSYLDRITVPDEARRSIESGPIKVDYDHFHSISPSVLSAVASLSMEATRPLLASLNPANSGRTLSSISSQSSMGSSTTPPSAATTSQSRGTDRGTALYLGSQSRSSAAYSSLHQVSSIGIAPSSASSSSSSSSAPLSPGKEPIPPEMMIDDAMWEPPDIGGGVGDDGSDSMNASYDGQGDGRGKGKGQSRGDNPTVDFPFLDETFSTTTLPPPQAMREESPGAPVPPASIASSTTSMELIQQLTSCITFCNHLATLQAAMDSARDETYASFPSTQEAMAALTQLAQTAIRHSRNYLLDAFNVIRQTEKQTHSRVMKEILMRSRGMMTFLRRNTPPTADECERAYIDSAARNQVKLCKTYVECLTRAIEEIASKNDLIGAAEIGRKAGFASIFKKSETTLYSYSFTAPAQPSGDERQLGMGPLSSSASSTSSSSSSLSSSSSSFDPYSLIAPSPSLSSAMSSSLMASHAAPSPTAPTPSPSVASSPFTLTATPSTLITTTTPSIQPFELGNRAHVFSAAFDPIHLSVLKGKKLKISFEEAFVSAHAPLAAMSVQETRFAFYFFSSTTTISPTMQPLINLYKDTFASLIGSCFDLVALLIIAREYGRLQELLHADGVVVLNEYFAALDQILWPQFRAVVKRHVESIPMPKKPKPIETTVHPITQRCAQLVSAVLALSIGYRSQPFVISTFGELITALLAFYTNHTKEIAEPRKSAFLLVNAYHIARVTEGKEECKEWYEKFMALFRTSLSTHTAYHLTKSFRSLSEYVATVTAAVQTNRTEGQAIFPVQVADSEVVRRLVSETTVANLASEMQMKWQAYLGQLVDDIIRVFQERGDAVVALEDAMNEVSQMYSVFVDVLHRCYADKPFRFDVVDSKVFNQEAKQKIVTFVSLKK